MIYTCLGKPLYRENIQSKYELHKLYFLGIAAKRFYVSVISLIGFMLRFKTRENPGC